MEENSIVKSKIVDKVNYYNNTGEVCATCFLDPLHIIENEKIYRNVPYTLIGGFENAERKRLIVGTEKNEVASQYIALLKIESNKKLSHRDVLGSLLGTGIKREVVGDIAINEDAIYIAVTKEISPYIISNLKKVARENVKVKEIDFQENIFKEEVFKEQNVTLSSLRIDSAISECYGLSRAVSVKLVEQEKVKLNYKVITNPSKAIKQNDLISVRGYGRFEIEEVVGETKKGRIRVTLKVASNNNQ